MIIEGTADAGYQAVREAFAANFTEHGDIGAAVCVYRDGRPVVDLWGGTADPGTGRGWQRDTLQLVYSATKGVVATIAHLLAQRGELDLDAPVAQYWPEFAAAGKADIPVRWLLTHRAGVAALDEPVALSEALAWQPMVDALAAQAPNWRPGTAFGYHGRTYGWLVGEVIRRVSGRTPGRFLAEEIAGPLGIDFFIGLPASERARVSRLVFAPAPDLTAVPEEAVPEPLRPLLTAMRDPSALVNRAFQITDPADIDFDSPAVQAAELPASNGIGTARGLARLYAALVGEVDGTRLLTADTLAAATREQVAGTDHVLMLPGRYASGYMLPTAQMPLGGRSSFGHPGRGGSLAFADPERRLAFAYVTNHIVEGALDLRARSLVDALDDAR
ncbi:serine hydrolase domain-containing protein [Nocardia implantans]|uniref:Serine hydrolase domain-containing protein n=1 Tax=Nocardia implantans TaxID=3108168 RepID=A0ABU6ASC0_9NOCA|nr:MULTISPECIES: serine hydrolase domain-containing protein [unclassified Nocardia]MBF6191694.1 beta-lactamase family protein [Nocardia beijingensis]MEA3527997.1 serine hydrolase domain-containing protein [Nocardia sp. CDC192]MEB3510251.1 serine hydrolase domain-containing protein [Nocardia sp. CDC186]